MKFKDAIETNQYFEESRTDNGMRAFATTSDKVLDFFGEVGSARGLDMTAKFLAALAENEELAVRALLWTRDVRGGAGERQQFRNLLQVLEKHNPKLAGEIMFLIPEIGRWDDLFSYQESVNKRKAFDMIGSALVCGNSLCAKWMPRKGNLARQLRNHLRMTPKQYRKLLVALSKDVVETKMCAKQWDAIDFSKVPSLAAARYQKAFMRNSKSYVDYVRALEDGEAKVNAGAVYPYDVVKSLQKGNEVVANAQWEALPDYVGDSKILPMVDTSGSMYVNVGVGLTALDVAVSLGLYLSSKNASDFKDVFMTFSAEPKFVNLKGSLYQKYRSLKGDNNWGMNTNLNAAFEALLEMAQWGNVSPQDMPDTILILSDMQFDRCVDYDDRAMEMIRRKYDMAGYEVPNVVFWNLTAGKSSTPVKINESGTALVSGFSPAITKSILSADPDEFSPLNIMLEALMVDRYTFRV